ncbi:MAG: GGDEF domain-containing protein [Bacilli bacterium]|nr:GGDEF domain-containing protein [Bacilli bacterium]
MNHLQLQDLEDKLDNVTDLNTLPFFVSQYNNYLNMYPSSNLIFIDFAKLKKINDELGHKAGDICLNSFGKILKTVFPTSLLARKHGDEFLILSHNSYAELENLFQKCNETIQNYFDLGMIPLVYHFNAGVVPAEHGIEPTINKADIMMYEAKKRGVTCLSFNQKLYDDFIKNKAFVTSTAEAIEQEHLTYAQRGIYDLNKEPKNISDIFTRDASGDNIFTENKFDLLRESNNLKSLDYLNLRKIILSSSIISGSKLMINIESNSLFNQKLPFKKFICALQDIMTGNPSDYIICVNLNSFKESSKELIENLKLLISLGFDVALSSFNLKENDPTLNIWKETKAKYIKVSPELWKTSQENSIYQSLLKKNVEVFLEHNTNPIFMKVETNDDLDYIKTLFSTGLIEGNVADKEQQIFFK